MTTRTHGFTLAIALSLLVGAPPALATAQDSATPESELVSEADQLRERALELQKRTSRLDDAARFHEKSAGLRPEGDRLGLESLWTAANLYYYADRPRRALSTLELAATAALARGDVLRAADAHIRAAVLAAELGEANAGHLHHRKATLLASSPLLAPDQREWILNRLPLLSG